jgi:hypothetical protein
MNVFFDVDHTLVFSQELRPGSHDAMRRLAEAGHTIYVWSAGGEAYSRRIVAQHELHHWVTDCFDKDPRVEPRPDIIIDDDWYLVEKYGGYLVSQYKAVNPEDREFAEILERLAELGHI